MSLILPNFGGTLSGGSSVALTIGPNSGTKAVFYAPGHTRLAAREVDFTVANAKTTNTDPGVARATAKVILADRKASESCCTVTSGSVIIDIGLRWSLSQDESLVDDALLYLQSIAFSDELRNAIVKAILP